MIDHELSTLNELNYKHIEDIIDARKELGQYNVNRQPNSINYRYVYSTSTGTNERFVRFNDLIMLNDGDTATTSSIKHTDSEITIVRIRQKNLSMEISECSLNKWDMQDVAIPGDGSHLGESPSLVNLATLVAKSVHNEGDEYLVPLSSWDPCLKNDDNAKLSQDRRLKYMTELCAKEEENREKPLDAEDKTESNSENESKSVGRKRSLAGRISKFIRKHYKKTKTLNDSDKI